MKCFQTYRYFYKTISNKIIYVVLILCLFAVQYFYFSYDLLNKSKYGLNKVVKADKMFQNKTKNNEENTGYYFGTEKNPVPKGYIDDVDKTLLDPYSNKTIPFLKNYQNSCWYMKLPSNVNLLYEENMFQLYASKSKDEFLVNLRRVRNDLITAKRTTQIKCLPHVYLLGLPKCGTTDIYYKLIKHHQLFAGQKKEYHWWNKGRYGLKVTKPRREIPLNDYIELFDGAAQSIREACPGTKSEDDYHPCLTMEASVSTFWFTTEMMENEHGQYVIKEPKDMLPAIMHKLQPNAKLMVTLRYPVSRCYSDYFFFNQNKTKDPAVFHGNALTSVKLFKDCIAVHGPRVCTYNKTLHKQLSVRLHISMYYIYMKDWLTIWPLSQMHAIKMEDYSTRNKESLREITDYLALEPFDDEVLTQLASKPPGNSNKPSTGGDIWPETKDILDEFFQPYNDMLAGLLRSEKFRWKSL